MEAKFEAKKKAILTQLGRPDEDYTDLSPKGSVDEKIRGLVNEINNAPGLVTTSSCSGRVVVYLEGSKAPVVSSAAVKDTTRGPPNNPFPAFSSSGGKGGGKWLFISHDRVLLDTLNADGDVYSLFGMDQQTDSSGQIENEPRRFVHLKFEPMILHILCSTVQKAQLVLNAATSAGFRESGISGVLDGKGRSTPPMVAVRSSGMAFDAMVAFSANGKIVPMVSEAYLRTMVGIANDDFTINEERTARFRHGLVDQIGTIRTGSPQPPPGVSRKQKPERILRKEARKAEARQRLGSATGENVDNCVYEADEDDDPATHVRMLMDP